MKTIERTQDFELRKLDRRAPLAPQLSQWRKEFAMKYRRAPRKIVWNPGGYRKAADDPELEVDTTVPKGFVRLVR